MSPTVVNGNPLAIEVGRDRERGIFPLVHTRKLPHTAVDKHKKKFFLWSSLFKASSRLIK